MACSIKAQLTLLLVLAIHWLGPTSGFAQPTIVYNQISYTNANPCPTCLPPPWDDSGFPIFGSLGGGLVLDLNGDGQPDVGFADDDMSFFIYGFGLTRVLTYPPMGLDINSFLPVLATGTSIGPMPTNQDLIWRETIDTIQPYSATYNGANSEGYGGFWQGVEGYTGVEFYIGNELHYGWIRVGVPFIGVNGGYVRSYAYEVAPNTPIKAGQISEPVSFSANLTGANEIPPNRSGHSGTGTFTLESFDDGFVLDYHLELDGAFVPTSAGIFGPASRKERPPILIADLGNGTITNFLPPVYVPLVTTFDFPSSTSLNPPGTISWIPSLLVYDGQITLSSNQAVQLSRGQLYINLKSARFRQGELRGEIWPDIPIQFTATLTGRGESPHKPRAKHDETTYGEAVFTLTGANLDGNVALNTDFAWNAMGIYAPNNDVREMLAVPLTNVVGVIIPAGGFPGHPDWPGSPGQVLYPESAALTDRQVVALKNGQLFLQVRFRNGSIGGQIVPE